MDKWLWLDWQGNIWHRRKDLLVLSGYLFGFFFAFRCRCFITGLLIFTVFWL